VHDGDSSENGLAEKGYGMGIATDQFMDASEGSWWEFGAVYNDQDHRTGNKEGKGKWMNVPPPATWFAKLGKKKTGHDVSAKSLNYWVTKGKNNKNPM
jgi:hypothetical protein